MKKPNKFNKDIKKYIQEGLKRALNESHDEKITAYYLKDNRGVTGVFLKPEEAKAAQKNHAKYFEATRGKAQLLDKEILLQDWKDGKCGIERIETYQLPTDTNLAESPAPATPTPVKTPPPTTTPNKRPNPIKIPKPGEYPKPRPKASMKQLHESSNPFEKLAAIERREKEKARMKRLINEAPMDIEGGPDQPHDSTRASIEGRGQENPFRAIELFSKQRLNQTTLEKIGSDEFNGIVRSLQNTPRLNMMQIGNAFQMIVMAESRHRGRLQELAKEIVQRKFGLSDDIMEMIEARLVNPGQIDSMDDEADDAEELAQNHFTPEELEVIKKHVDKRIVHNTLMMGAGYRAHKVFDELEQALNALDPQLYPLYRSIMPNMELFLWQMDIEAVFGARVNLGSCKVEDDGNCKAKAVIFPILLHEVAKGAVEILFLQHLADIQKEHGELVAQQVVKDADSYKDEHWLKLIGPQLWKYLHDALSYVVEEENEDYTIISYVLNRMATMTPEAFMSLMDDAIHDGPTAIEKIKAIMAEVRNDIDAYENQNNEVPAPEDITPEESNEDEIAALLRQNQDSLLQTPTEDRQGYQKSLDDMEIDELNNELNAALEIEDYGRAAQIRDIIANKRNG